MSPTKIELLLGKITKNEIQKDDFILLSHFKGSTCKNTFNFKNPNWGIPVRPHDVKKLANKFIAPVYEFHVSYSDLERDLPKENWDILHGSKILVHAPELFSDSRLLNFCDKENIAVHNR